MSSLAKLLPGAVIFLCSFSAAFGEPLPNKGVSVEIKVMASPQLAFEAVRSLRDPGDKSCKVISSSSTESIVEEVFDGLPVIGQATCLYREVYEQANKLSFKMIRSDKLQAFEGEWTLQPLDNGEHTLVKLRSYIDIGLKFPLARQITEATSRNELKQQIADVKKIAESRQKSLAAQKQKAGI